MPSSSSNTPTSTNVETPPQYCNNNNNLMNPIKKNILIVQNPFAEEDSEQPPQIMYSPFQKSNFDQMREMRIRQCYVTDPNQAAMLKERMPFHYQALLPSGRGTYPYPTPYDQVSIYHQMRMNPQMMMNSGFPPMMNAHPMMHTMHQFRPQQPNGMLNGMGKISPGQFPPNIQQIKAAAAAGIMHSGMMQLNSQQLPQTSQQQNVIQKPPTKAKKREKPTKKQQQQAAAAQAQSIHQQQQQRLMLLGMNANGMPSDNGQQFSPAYMAAQNELRQRLQTPNCISNESSSLHFKGIF